VTAHITSIETVEYGLYLSKEARHTAGYYSKDGLCRWVGRGVPIHFGLSGEASEEQIANLLSRKSPDGHDLGIRSGAMYRPGFDLCVDDDKTLNLIRYLGPDEAGEVISHCRQEAADLMFRYAEENLAWTRKGKRGVIKEQIKELNAFCVRHDRSREDDMHEHFHYGIVNAVRCADGEWRALDAKPLFDNQLCLSAIHQLQLSYLVERERGLRTERATEVTYENGQQVTRKRNWFVCSDMNHEAAKGFFSKRRGQIKDDMAERGVKGAKEAKRSGERTRKEKDYSVTTEDLIPRWRDEAAAKYGLTMDAIRAMFWKAPKRTDTVSERIDRAITAGTKLLSERQAHFSKHDLVRYACTEAISEAVPADLLVAEVEHRLEHSPEFVKRGECPRETRFTTRENYELEKELLAKAEILHERHGHAVSPHVLERVLAKRQWKTIKPEQREAVRNITQGSDLMLVAGMAGAGKSFMLGCANQVWTTGGHKVIGAAFTGRAGALLQKESGLETSTIHRLLKDLDSGFADDMKHHAKQLLRAALGKRTFNRDKITLDSSTVLVLDECGQVPTHLLKRVLDHCERAGAAVVMVGDARQVQPIAPGGPFKSLTERLPQSTSTLRDITRQKEAWQIRAVHHFADGEAREALELFKKHGCLSVTSAGTTLETMVSDWAKAGGVKSPEKHFLLATTRASVSQLNRMAQARRLAKGELSGFRMRLGKQSLYLGTPHITDGEDKIFQNDRVMLGRNFTTWEGRKVSNGDLATVLRIDPVKNTIDLAIDGQRKPITLSVKAYNRYGDAIHLGYASTVYKSQGSSLSSIYAEAGADRELSYVAASRHKVRCQLYASESDMGEDGEDLIRTMSRSHQKNLFHDIPEPESRKRLSDLTHEMEIAQ
jgi:conjugative relaxase-like TrwC/TraI family protein